MRAGQSLGLRWSPVQRSLHNQSLPFATAAPKGLDHLTYPLIFLSS